MKKFLLLVGLLVAIQPRIFGCACCLDPEDMVYSKEDRLAEFPYPISEITVGGGVLKTNQDTIFKLAGEFRNNSVSFHALSKNKSVDFNFAFNGTIERQFKSDEKGNRYREHRIYGTINLSDDAQKELGKEINGSAVISLRDQSNACIEPESFYHWSLEFTNGKVEGKPSTPTRREKARVKNDEGMKAYRQKEYSEAEVLFTDAVSFDENYYLAMTNLACVLSLLNKREMAIGQLKIAMEKNPEVTKRKMREDKDYDTIRADPDFISLLNSK